MQRQIIMFQLALCSPLNDFYTGGMQPACRPGPGSLYFKKPRQEPAVSHRDARHAAMTLSKPAPIGRLRRAGLAGACQ